MRQISPTGYAGRARRVYRLECTFGEVCAILRHGRFRTQPINRQAPVRAIGQPLLISEMPAWIVAASIPAARLGSCILPSITSAESIAAWLCTSALAGGHRRLAKVLRAEVERRGVEFIIHPTVQELLTSLGDTVVAIDEQTIGVSIVESVTPSARVIVTERGPFELGRALAGRINGYATPKEALIAVFFDLYFTDVGIGDAI
jgi:hypothetical protein